MSRNHQEIRASDNQSKFIQDRISQVEKHFGELCTNFGNYSRRVSKVRDSGDSVARSIYSYAENERLNLTTREALISFAEKFSAVQDYRESQVKRLEAKVVNPLSLYGTNCKNAKERLKQAFAARDRENKQKKNLDRVLEKSPSDRHQISQAETNLQKAAVDASYSSRALEEEIDHFESKKLGDIKLLLMDFVNVEMSFHAKALEFYTQCHQSLSIMDGEEDLQEFRNSLRPPALAARLALHGPSKNDQSSLTGTPTRQRATNLSKTTTPQQVKKPINWGGGGSLPVTTGGGSGSLPINADRTPKTSEPPKTVNNLKQQPTSSNMYDDIDDEDDDSDDYEEEYSVPHHKPELKKPVTAPRTNGRPHPRG